MGFVHNFSSTLSVKTVTYGGATLLNSRLVKTVDLQTLSCCEQLD